MCLTSDLWALESLIVLYQAFKYVDFDPSVRGWANEGEIKILVFFPCGFCFRHVLNFAISICSEPDIDESAGGANIDPAVSLRDTWTGKILHFMLVFVLLCYLFSLATIV